MTAIWPVCECRGFSAAFNKIGKLIEILAGDNDFAGVFAHSRSPSSSAAFSAEAAVVRHRAMRVDKDGSVLFVECREAADQLRVAVDIRAANGGANGRCADFAVGPIANRRPAPATPHDCGSAPGLVPFDEDRLSQRTRSLPGYHFAIYPNCLIGELRLIADRRIADCRINAPATIANWQQGRVSAAKMRCKYRVRTRN